MARARFPDEPPLDPWSTGTSLAYVKDLIHYWKSGFDWRAQEGKLNQFKQFTISIGGIELHFIHEPGRGANPVPLLLLHGWPSSVWEFNRLMPLLSQRFTVVAPSLPGFTLSFTPGQERFGVPQMADLFAQLMSVLGYPRFGAQGGDWGASIATRLGFAHAQRLIGIHLNLLSIPRDADLAAGSPEEERDLAQLKHFMKVEKRTRSPIRRQASRRGSPKNFAPGATLQ